MYSMYRPVIASIVTKKCTASFQPVNADLNNVDLASMNNTCKIELASMNNVVNNVQL